MAVRYKGCRVDWLLSKLYNLLLGYLRDEHFFFLFTRGNWKKPIYPLIVIGFSFSFNQLWYLRVSNSPEAGATSLLCHLLVIHPYGKRILCRGSDTVPTAFFVTSSTGPTAVADVPMQRMTVFFFLPEVKFTFLPCQTICRGFFTKSAVRRSFMPITIIVSP